MYLKAILICEDVRVELNGSFTLVGVQAERLIIPRGDGPIAIARFACVVMIGGLTGVKRLGFRQRIREATGPEVAPAAPEDLEFQAHDPAADEHNFVFGEAPMVFPGAGSYEIACDVAADGQQPAMFRYRFRLERAAG